MKRDKESKRGSGDNFGKSVAKKVGVTILSKILILVIIVMTVMLIVPKLNPFNYIKGWFSTESAVENHDLTLENHRFFGFKVADFEEAILGKAESKQALEVYTREVSDVTTVLDAGLGGLKIFSKSQVLTFYGTAIYTVDLSKLNKDSIEYDKSTGKVTLYVPRPELTTLDVPPEKIQAGEVQKGKLAFGEVNMTAEQTKEVATAAKEKMRRRLEDENVIADAEKMAISNIWSLYQPTVSNVKAGCTLEVKFAEEN